MPPSIDFRSKQTGENVALTWLSSTKIRSSTVRGSDNDILEETSGSRNERGSRNETARTSAEANGVSSPWSRNSHGDATATEKISQNFTLKSVQPTSIIFILDPWISQNDPLTQKVILLVTLGF